MSSSKEIKSKLRRSKEWKEFRKKLISTQKIDPITKKKLTSGCNCHHLDLNSNHYSDLKEENFVVLNRQSHELIHVIFR